MEILCGCLSLSWFLLPLFIVVQVQGIGLMLEAMSNKLIPYHVGMFFIPLFITAYLIMGGMKGAAWVNTIQGIFFYGYFALFRSYVTTWRICTHYGCSLCQSPRALSNSSKRGERFGVIQ